MAISISPLPGSKRGKYSSPLRFGDQFTDHMFSQYYARDKGWHKAEINPFHNFTLSPATSVLHYGQEIFEGMKAYRRNDGAINLFRPEDNFKRFNRSAERMAMPSVDEALHLEALIKLIELDCQWVPTEESASLYIRPAMIATSVGLGLKSSEEYIHFLIACPVGSYFKNGLQPVSVLISDSDRRAVIGGVGGAKTGGNYAASLKMGEKASQAGYSQVLWLDAIEGRYIEEVGAMNICFVYEGKHIVTPELSGSILRGITRDSLFTLAPTLGYSITEEKLDVHDVLAAISKGQITEVFGTGTAAVIAPVGSLSMNEQDYEINGLQTGPVALHLHEALTNIQYGRSKDSFGWITTIDV